MEGISPEQRDARAVQDLKQSYKMRERLLLLLLAVPWIHGEYLVGHPGPSILWDAAGESGSGSTPLLRDAPPVEAAGSGGGGGSGSGSGMPFINVRECCRVDSLSGYLSSFYHHCSYNYQSVWTMNCWNTMELLWSARRFVRLFRSLDLDLSCGDIMSLFYSLCCS